MIATGFARRFPYQKGLCYEWLAMQSTTVNFWVIGLCQFEAEAML